MKTQTPTTPVAIEIPLSALVDLAVDAWRLSRWAEAGETAGNTAPARHAARRLTAFVQEHGLELLDLTGRTYDCGLAIEIVDTVDSAEGTAVTGVIAEMVAPIVMFRGLVARQGQIVLATQGNSSTARAFNHG